MRFPKFSADTTAFSARRSFSSRGNIMLFTGPKKRSRETETYFMQACNHNFKNVGNMEPLHMEKVSFREILFNLHMTKYFQNHTVNEALYFLLMSRQVFDKEYTTFETNYCNFIFIQLYHHLRKNKSYSLIPLIQMHVARPMLRKCGYNLKYLLSFYITAQSCRLTDTDYIKINRDIFSNMRYKRGLFLDYRNMYSLVHGLVMRLNNVDPVLAKEKFGVFFLELAKTYVRGFNHIFIDNKNEVSVHAHRGRPTYIYKEMISNSDMFVKDMSEAALSNYLNAVSLFGVMENFDQFIRQVTGALHSRMGGLIRSCVRADSVNDETNAKFKSYKLSFDNNPASQDDVNSKLFKYLQLLLNSRSMNQEAMPAQLVLNAKMTFNQKLHLCQTYFKPMLEYLTEYIDNYIYNDLANVGATREFDKVKKLAHNSNVYIDWLNYELTMTRRYSRRMYSKKNLHREHVKKESMHLFHYSFKNFALFTTRSDPLLLANLDEYGAGKVFHLQHLKEDVCCIYLSAMQCLRLAQMYEEEGGEGGAAATSIAEARPFNFPLVLTGDGFKDFGVIFKALPASDLMNLQFNQWVQMVRLTPRPKGMALRKAGRNIYNHKLIPVANHEQNKIDFLFEDRERLYRI